MLHSTSKVSANARAQRVLVVCSVVLATITAWAQPTRNVGDDGAGAARESTASQEIQWRLDGSGTSWESGPAEVRWDQPLRLRVKPVSGASIRWYQIIPDTRKFYKNANHPWEPDAYKWVGYGKIDYLRREFAAWRGSWEVRLGSSATSRPDEPPQLDYPEAGPYYRPEVGSFWFDVEILSAGRILRSPGLRETTERGLSTKVFRLSRRQDDSLVGWLTSFFNVPGVFGSTPWQSGNYIGVDCADCMAAAWSKWKGKTLTRDWNVAGIVGEWPKEREFDLEEGTPSGEIRWGTDIRPGDFVAVRYPGRRQYQHIGALYADANKNGKLDAEDLVIHAGPQALQISRLSAGNFDGRVSVIRATAR
ncbi:MAG: hypothetical protein AMXMBFR13_33500 [Phycisphaerae bacterium]